MLRTIERPTNATLRPCRAATSRICWTRWTCDAKHATMTRRSARVNTASSTGSIDRSGGTKPGTSALVESTRNRSTPSSPSRANARRSVIRPSSGSWSILKSPVCSTSWPDGRPHRDRQRVRDRVVHRDELGLERAEPLDLSLRHLQLQRLDPVLAQLRLDQRQGQPGADQRDVRSLAQQVRHPADVVLVAVGEDDRVDVVQARADVVEVRQDQVDAGLVVLGEQHAAVDDEQPAGVLEDRHVAADLAEAAERDDAEAAVGAAGAAAAGVTAGWVMPRIRRPGRRPGPAPAARSARPSRRPAAGAAGRPAGRGGPARPWSGSTPWVRNMPTNTGSSSWCSSRARSTSPSR